MTKLAEALANRATAQTRLRELRARVAQNVLYQEGAEPLEDAAALLAESERVADELERLIKAINRTNAVTPFDGERTLTDALAERDVLALRRKAYAEAAEAASGPGGPGGMGFRMLHTELRFVTAVSVPEVRAKADDLARQYRELDVRIQELNWATDVVEQ